jgi:hypothetical protein
MLVLRNRRQATRQGGYKWVATGYVVSSGCFRTRRTPSCDYVGHAIKADPADAITRLSDALAPAEHPATAACAGGALNRPGPLLRGISTSASTQTGQPNDQGGPPPVPPSPTMASFRGRRHARVPSLAARAASRGSRLDLPCGRMGRFMPGCCAVARPVSPAGDVAEEAVADSGQFL